MCDLTAIVGVSKHTEKATGELIETQIKFAKESLASNDHSFAPHMMFSAAPMRGRAMAGAPRMRKSAAPSGMMMKGMQGGGGPPQAMAMCAMPMAPPGGASMMRGGPPPNMAPQMMKSSAAPEMMMMESK